MTDELALRRQHRDDDQDTDEAIKQALRDGDLLAAYEIACAAANKPPRFTDNDVLAELQRLGTGIQALRDQYRETYPDVAKAIDDLLQGRAS